MPNWCYTSINIRTDKKGGLVPFANKVDAWVKEGTKIKNSWDNSWLGLLVEKGLEIDPVDGPYECRGSFYDFDINPDGDEISVGTETAWAPMLEMWYSLVEKYCPEGTRILWTAEESGMGIYVSNDPDYENKFYIDSWGEIEPEWVVDEDDARDVAQEVYDKYGNSDSNDFIRNATGCKRVGKKIAQNFIKTAPMGKIIDFVETMWEEAELSIRAWEYEPDAA